MTEHIEQIRIPDIGGAANVDVIEVMVKPGDQVNAEDSLLTLEGDKATMEVPSPLSGIVNKVIVKTGDKVSAGDLILELKITNDSLKSSSTPEAHEKSQPQKNQEETNKFEIDVKENSKEASSVQSTTSLPTTTEKTSTKTKEEFCDVLAGPSARRLAREVGISLSQIAGTGEKGRISKEDVQTFIQQKLASAGSGANINFPEMPTIDFAKFGEVELHALSKIKKISGAALHRNWVSIPHVTQFAEADITELENFRQSQKKMVELAGTKLTPIVFIMKAVVAALRKFPLFNSSLDPAGHQLILKKYFHIGVAVDTPNGLVVPVIRHVNQKGLLQLAKELHDVSKKVRETGLSLSDMQGGCFSISSLGGIGGTAFTPIINAPEVAILGVSKSEIKPVYNREQFVPRLMLPLSLSYDHRVIDGAEAARFIVYLTECLSDIRTLLL